MHSNVIGLVGIISVVILMGCLIGFLFVMAEDRRNRND
jgi:hypothetical protein